MDDAAKSAKELMAMDGTDVEIADNEREARKICPCLFSKRKKSVFTTIVLDVNPRPKPRMTRADAWKKRPIVVKYWQYCDELRLEAKRKKLGEIKAPLSIEFTVPMPKSWSKKKKSMMLGKPHESKPDLDNFIKAFKDALLDDDAHIYEYRFMKKVWGHQGKIELFCIKEKP